MAGEQIKYIKFNLQMLKSPFQYLVIVCTTRLRHINIDAHFYYAKSEDLFPPSAALFVSDLVLMMMII